MNLLQFNNKSWHLVPLVMFESLKGKYMQFAIYNTRYVWNIIHINVFQQYIEVVYHPIKEFIEVKLFEL